MTDKLDKILENFETGDILLFHGINFWFSYLVEWGTWSQFSHVGIVLKNPTYIDSSLKGYYMLEAGEEKFPDAVYHKIEFGVQIVDLKKVMKMYEGQIFHRSLKVEDVEIIEKIPNKLGELWGKIKNLPYDDSPFDLLRVEFQIQTGDMKRTNTFFCSALTTFIYEQLDLMDIQLLWDMVKPQDFDDNGKIDDSLKKCVKLIPKKLIEIGDIV